MLTFYKWRAKYGGMDVPDVRRLRELEAENKKLKKLLYPDKSIFNASSFAFILWSGTAPSRIARLLILGDTWFDDVVIELKEL